MSNTNTDSSLQICRISFLSVTLRIAETAMRSIICLRTRTNTALVYRMHCMHSILVLQGQNRHILTISSSLTDGRIEMQLTSYERSRRDLQMACRSFFRHAPPS
jgi:hypothetical protein